MKLEINYGVTRRVIEIGEISKDSANGYFVAAIQNGEELYKLFLALGADPNINDKEAMKRAVANNDLKNVKCLKEYGASLEVDLTQAIENGYIDLVSYMLNNGAECKKNYITVAILSGDEDMVRTILQKGNNVEVTQQDVRKAIKISPNIAGYVIKFFNGDTGFLTRDLEEAIEKADVKVAELLFKTLSGNMIAMEAKPDYAKMVGNCNDAGDLNDMIEVIQRYRPQLLAMNDEKDVCKFYPKATMQTFALLGGIAMDASYETMLARAMSAGNRQLVIEIIKNTDVEIEKLVTYNVI